MAVSPWNGIGNLIFSILSPQSSALFFHRYVSSHSRFQFAFTVINANFDAEDLMVAFVAALNVARREFALGVDLFDHAVEGAVFERVHFDPGFLADLDQTKLGFGDVN